MLIDDWLPAADITASYATTIDAPPEVVYRAVRGLDMSRSPIVRGLFFLRELPARLAGRGGMPLGLTIDALVAMSFVILADEPPRELVLGVVGRPWTIDGGLQHLDRDAFRAFSTPGFAKVAWNFAIDGARLVTETRIQCTDAASLSRFRRYWFVIGPFSGLIRRDMLRAIRRAVRAAPARA